MVVLSWWVNTESTASAASLSTTGVPIVSAFAPASNGSAQPILLESTNGDPTLSIQGGCPGTMTVAVDGLSPDGGVLVYRGSGPGSTGLDGLCSDALIGLADARRVEEFEADAAGELRVTREVPAAACGDYLQLVDVCTCNPTNISPVL